MRRSGLLGLGVLLLVAIGAALLWPEPAPLPQVGSPVRPPPEAVQQRGAPDAVRTGERPAAVGLWVLAADTGQPIAGARVWRGDTSVALTSDARGAVVFEAADGGERLEVSAPFMKTREDTFRPGDTVELEPLPMVRGLVLVPSETPQRFSAVPGALVTSATPPFTQTVTDAQGQFQLRMAAFGVLAARSGERFGTTQFLEEGEEVTIHLEEPRFEEGTVVDRGGRPLEGAVVTWSAGSIVEQQTTGADGKWRAPSWTAWVEVGAEKAGYLPWRQRRSTHPWQVPAVRVITLPRPASVTGVLRTVDGRFVEGASVRGAGGAAAALTGPGGRFALEGLAPGPNTLTATFGTQTGEASMELVEGSSARAVIVLQPPLLGVPLQLVDEHGVEQPCLTALATPLPEEGWTSELTGGLLPLRKGRFRLEVTAEDGAAGDTELEVDPKPGMAPLRLAVRHDPADAPEPEKPDQQVTVRVKDPSGVAVGGATVRCGGTEGLTREDGSFPCVLSPYVGRPVRVTAKKGLSSGLAPAFGQERELELIIKPVRTLRGRIEGPLQPGARHHLQLHSVFEAGEVPLTGSEFVLADLSPVRTLLCVMRETERVGCTVVDDERTVTIPVGPPGAFTVTVLDAQGAPLETPVLYLSRSTVLPPAPKGVVTLATAPGTFVLIINAQGTTARAETVFTVRSGQTTQLGTLQLK